ncbi:unknown seed protein 30.1-like [Neltuma alba]|uniref:unknown seed protein 30.1-like n=1 Tax=Neltuma alba TaxID=207710 RepID=UPI0010A3BCE0|nr:unknown seed protein 30.1-like [Prosopis alba]
MNIIFKSPYANEEQKIDIVEKDPEKSLSSQSWNVLSEKSSLNQPYGVGTWKRNIMDVDKSSLNQPYGVGTWKRSTVDVNELSLNQPYGVGTWKRSIVDDRKSSLNQLYGVGTWKRSAGDDDESSLNQPYGVGTWKRSTVDVDQSSLNQPYGVGMWKRSEEDVDQSSLNQPYGVGTWKRSTVDDKESSLNQPYGVGTWKRSVVDDKESILNQPYGVGTWKKNTVDVDKSSLNQPYGVGTWKRKTMVNNEPKSLRLKKICNVKERFVGEDGKFCAESVKSLLDFVISKLGKEIEALTSSFVPHQTQYTILEGVQRVSSEGVMCHKLNFKKPVFYCHQVNATITYIVPMKAADGTRTNIVALCHRDTRGMDPHKLFHQLKVLPGTVPVCHFLGSGAISWVPRNNELKASR